MGRISRCFLVGLALVFALSMVGCGSGTAGGGGGTGGGPAQVSAVEVSDDGTTARMTVNFALFDSGKPLAGVAPSDIQFTVAKLIPGSSPSSWQNYINTTETKAAGDPGTTPDGTTAYQATTERANKAGGVFTDNGDGTYSYKLSFNLRAVTTPVLVTYEPSLTHRIAMQVKGNAFNAIYDFVPSNPNATPATRSIVDNGACSECHKKFDFHGGDRVSVKYCVTCHNPGSTDANSGNTLDFTVMVHKIHRNYLGADDQWVKAGGVYTIWGFNNEEFSFSEEVVFPQDIRNCTKCHDGADPATPDGDNWKNMPSEAACTSCHDAPDPVKFPTFPNLTPAEIQTHMATSNATPNNPTLPPGVPRIEYVLNSATVNGTTVVINFQILRDGVALNLKNLPADLLSQPAFLLAYTQAQDGIITNPAEYNNFGRSAAQPRSVNLDQAFRNTLVDNGDGTFTATIANAFPAGATLRAVGLQGYYQWDGDGSGTFTTTPPDYPLHTPSAIIAVSGDASRREVVDNNNCAKCHEWFEGHGGSRVFNMNICVFCHNPNLSSSGRAVPAATASPEVKAAYGSNPLTYPEAKLNFKDMVHAIHGVETRTTDYEFVRNRNAGTGDGIPYNFGDVGFPGRAGDCLTCHKPGTYAVPLINNTLLTTNRTTGVVNGQDATTAAVTAARTSVPNATDFVITPTAAACFACHDSDLAKAHMIQNGAAINSNRSAVLGANSLETCSLCHGTGRSVDIAVVHATEVSTLIGVIKAPAQEGGSGGGQSQADLCGPGPVSSQPAGHTTSTDCCSCHSQR
jgi:OmcA/MtrC family decaheme c-type cytochrome